MITLNATEWITIILAALGAAWAGVWGTVRWLLARSIAKIDQHEKTLYGGDGDLSRLRAEVTQIAGRLPGFLTQKDIDVHIRDLNAQMGRMRAEGQQREDRILGAIDKVGERSSAENGQIRGDVSQLSKRIDSVVDSRHGPSERNRFRP